MNNKAVIQIIDRKLDNLTEENLKEVDNYIDYLLKISPDRDMITSVRGKYKNENISNFDKSSTKQELEKFTFPYIAFIRGKYKNHLSSSDSFSKQKKEEIDWEDRNV
jgi:hypothetical protein